MKGLHYTSQILLFLAMIFCGFFNFTAWAGLTFRSGEPVLGWTLLAAMLLSFSAVILFLKLKKYVCLVISSALFPVTSVIIGNILNGSAQIRLAFEVFLRNHVSTLLIPVFAALCLLTFHFLPEQKYKRASKEKYRLKPEDRII